MTGLRRFDGDAGGLQVPYLTHHNDVRVLAQKGPERLTEVHALFRVYVDLVDAFEVNFYRILCGGDITLRGVENI